MAKTTKRKPPKPAYRNDEGKEPVYAFPSRSRCPRCDSTMTEAYATKGPVQYRRCTHPVCRETFTVRGEPI